MKVYLEKKQLSCSYKLAFRLRIHKKNPILLQNHHKHNAKSSIFQCQMDGMPMLSWPYEWFDYVHSWIDAIFDFMSHPDGDSENIFIIKIGEAGEISTNSYKIKQSSKSWSKSYIINNNNPKEITVFNSTIQPTVQIDVIKPDALTQYNITAYTRENYDLDLKSMIHENHIFFY